MIKAKDVLYPFQYVLQKRNIVFDEDFALIIKPLPDDVRYPANAKITDSGQLLTYKVSISINDQNCSNESELMNFINQKVILVFQYLNAGRTIIGCNENALQFLFEDDNASSASQSHGYNIECSGNTYFTKVNL
ncbi:MAG: hypothetical protein ACK4ON_04595 [Bacteroidia bacterium]